MSDQGEDVAHLDTTGNKRSRMDAGLGEGLSLSEKQEAIRRYTQAFNRDQLLTLLVDVGTNIPAAYADIVRMACDNMVNRKLFVRGISWSTTNESLAAAFQEFGDVEEATVVMDKHTGKSKGFGFVRFASGESAFAALARGSLSLDGRSVQFNLASIRPDQALGAGAGLSFSTPAFSAPAFSAPAFSGAQRQSAGGSFGGAYNAGGQAAQSFTPSSSGGEDVTARKIFVRGLSWETNDHTLRQAFEMFGPVEETCVVVDKSTGRSKGFGFVTFASSASTQKAIAEPQREIEGRMTTCNLAADGGKGGGGGGGRFGGQGGGFGSQGQGYQAGSQGASYGYQQQFSAAPQYAQGQQSGYGAAAPQTFYAAGSQAQGADQQQQQGGYGGRY